MICITIHEATKSRIIWLTKTEGLLPSNSQFLMKRYTTKDSEVRQLIKPWPTRTIPNQNEPKPSFETGQCPTPSSYFSLVCYKLLYNLSFLYGYIQEVTHWRKTKNLKQGNVVTSGPPVFQHASTVCVSRLYCALSRLKHTLLPFRAELRGSVWHGQDVTKRYEF